MNHKTDDGDSYESWVHQYHLKCLTNFKVWLINSKSNLNITKEFKSTLESNMPAWVWSRITINQLLIRPIAGPSFWLVNQDFEIKNLMNIAIGRRFLLLLIQTFGLKSKNDFFNCVLRPQKQKSFSQWTQMDLLFFIYRKIVISTCFPIKIHLRD